ncbi:hypothetical protein ACJIZ3_025835 [Penstemon smallii]|uniref:C3H1-type domain-containing protein n=1 Tax=Penstemon smallii TaxID=265156 RepID=A0ABD3TVP2_9LAMI
MNVQTKDSFASLLELAANNDIEGFKKYIDQEPSRIDEIGLWYGREKSSNKMVLHHRTPLMVASTYGSIDVLKLLVSSPEVDPNQSCGIDKSTALHCAASSGSINAVDIIKLLLASGADPNIPNADGLCPIHVIVVSPKLQSIKYSLQMMLEMDSSNSSSPPISEKKEYPFDPSLPDINNGIFSTDEFRMYSFKVRPCSRAYSHDWTECPFVHPGENARRRDPRKFHYSCVPCPDFRKGACRRGDLCEYAHGVFECWLHPAQYRTRLCKDGTNCNRRVCFFAHKQDELRNLSPSSNSISNTGWPSQQNIPALQLPVSNFLRSSPRARDFPMEDLSLFPDIRNEISLMSPQPSMNRFCRSKTPTPLNLEDIYSAESSSPRYLQSMVSPIKTNFSPRNFDQSLMQANFGVEPVSARVSMLAREKQNQQFRSHSSRDLFSNGPMEWGSPNGPPEWQVPGDEFGKLKRSSSFELLNNEEEPDLSWVQSLVKESPQDIKDKYAPGVADVAVTGTYSGGGANEQVDQSVLGAWLEKMQIDRLMAK